MGDDETKAKEKRPESVRRGASSAEKLDVVESRASPPGWTGETPVAPSYDLRHKTKASRLSFESRDARRTALPRSLLKNHSTF